MTQAYDIIEQRAAHWLLRREADDWSSVEEDEFAGWLDESTAHKAAFWRLEHGWQQANRLAALRTDKLPTPSKAAYWRRAIQIAAVVVFALLTSLTPAWLTNDRGAALVKTPIGGHRSVALRDGSKIELNTATVLRTAVTERKREVWLESGEAYFEVAKDRGRTFVVHIGSRTVTVLGTKFSILRVGNDVKVVVAEGKVRLDQPVPAHADRPTFITAGEFAIAGNNATLVAPVREDQIESNLAWREGMLRFDQSSLAEVVKEFNRYNKKQVVLADTEVAHLEVGGAFQTTNISGFLRLLQDAYGLKITDDGDWIEISSS